VAGILNQVGAIFDDNEGAEAVRERHYVAHLDYREAIRIAGV